MNRLIFVSLCLLCSAALPLRAAELSDLFFSVQQWSTLSGSLRVAPEGVSQGAEVMRLYRDNRGDLALQPPEGSDDPWLPATIFFNGRYYSGSREHPIAQGQRLGADHAVAALDRLLAAGPHLQAKAQMLEQHGRTLRLRWSDWSNCPVLELQLAENGRLLSARSLSPSASVDGVVYGLSGGKVYVNAWTQRTPVRSVFGGVSTVATVLSLSAVEVDRPLPKGAFELP